MLNIKENISLKKYNTFNIGGEAKYFVLVESIDEIKEALNFAKNNNLRIFILAGGSNVLFSDLGFDGLVIKINLKTIEFDEQNLKVLAGAGVMLSGLINLAVEKNLSGMENLFGIPGTVGGAVRGNAGAFGTEIKDVVFQVEALNVETEEIKILTEEECKFEYRNSFFKKNKNWIILKVFFKLSLGNQEQSKNMIKEVMERRKKIQLQGVKSAGSFFANPIAPKNVQLLFEQEKNTRCIEGRVPAGWLLDKVGLREEKIGDISTGENQANYFINLGNGTFDQVLQLSSMAKMRVRDEFGVQLREEVEIVY